MEKVSVIDSGITTQKIKKSKKEPKEKGSWRAVGASQIAGTASLPVSMAAIAGMSQVNKKLTPEQIEQINKAADAMIDAKGLRAKGVKIDNVTSAGLNLTGIPDSIYDMINSYSAVAHGKNAAFLPKDAKNALTGEILHSKNTIIANRDKMSTALFHEIGHAFNANKSKFWKVMQNLRIPSMVLASGLAIFAAFTKKAEAKDGEELTKGQKAKNFVRNNAGYIAGASMLPVIAEEVMATVRGCKWANANLPKELAKKVRTTNIFGAVSYVAASAAIALSAFVATKVKDSIMEKQKAKLETEQNNNIQPQPEVVDEE